MYIWFAIDVNNSLKHLRKYAKEISSEIDFKENQYSLPFHISLKISCLIKDEDYDSIFNDVVNYFNTLKPFKINTNKIELNDTICWLTMKENKNLVSIHEYLDDLFKNKYGYNPHPFDLEFMYHTTLVLDSNINLVKEAYLKLKDFKVPKTLTAYKFIIGGSKNGKTGTYSVYQTIERK